MSYEISKCERKHTLLTVNFERNVSKWQFLPYRQISETGLSGGFWEKTSIHQPWAGVPPYVQAICGGCTCFTKMILILSFRGVASLLTWTDKMNISLSYEYIYIILPTLKADYWVNIWEAEWKENRNWCNPVPGLYKPHNVTYFQIHSNVTKALIYYAHP